MTTKEIAEAVGKTERCVQGWAKKTGEKIASIGEKIASVQKTGSPADYDLSETCFIIETGMGKNAANLYRMSAKETLPATWMERAFEMMASSFERLCRITESQEARLQKIEVRIEERQALLPPPQVKPRDHINMIVRSYASRNAIDHSSAWGTLYKEYSYRTNTNPRASAQHRGMQIIDYIDAEGMIETLESIAMEIMDV